MCIAHLLQAPPDFNRDHLTSAEQTTPILPEGLRSGPLCVHIIKPQISSWHLGTIIAPQTHEASIRLPAAWQLIPIGHACSGDRNCPLFNQATQNHVWMGPFKSKVTESFSYQTKNLQTVLDNFHTYSFRRNAFGCLSAFEMVSCLWFPTAAFPTKLP